MSPESLTAALKEEALRLGFALAGACPAVATPDFDRLKEWISAGRAGQMRYFADRLDAYSHPQHVLDKARSLLMLAMNYRTREPAVPAAGQARVSRYAWGSDYHEVVRDRLRQLAEFHRRLVPGAMVRGVVDTAPLMERQFARLAGLGWQGKNTLLLNRELGSWFFLAALLTSEELQYDQPFTADHCGTCRACLDACPTGALVGPYQLDARACISYLTIELKGEKGDKSVSENRSYPSPLPLSHEGERGSWREFRGRQGQWVFGCDICQEVCPWNRRTPSSSEEAFQPDPDRNPASPGEMLQLDEAEFSRRFRHTPLARPKRGGLLRNAAIVLGNWGGKGVRNLLPERPDQPSVGARCFAQKVPDPFSAALPALLHGLADADPQVRGACAWALGRYTEPAASEALLARAALEVDLAVREEIAAALAGGLEQP